MSGTSKNATQTNANQADLARQQAATEQALIAAQSHTTDAIVADIGSGAPVIPTPPNLPSIGALVGPGETHIMRQAAIDKAASSASELSLAVDPNEVGILKTFSDSAHGLEVLQAQEVGSGIGGTGIANPLGPQVTYADINPSVTSTTQAGKSGSGVTSILFLGIAGVGAFLYFKMHKAHPSS